MLYDLWRSILSVMNQCSTAPLLLQHCAALCSQLKLLMFSKNSTCYVMMFVKELNRSSDVAQNTIIELVVGVRRLITSQPLTLKMVSAVMTAKRRDFMEEANQCIVIDIHPNEFQRYSCLKLATAPLYSSPRPDG